MRCARAAHVSERACATPASFYKRSHREHPAGWRASETYEGRGAALYPPDAATSTRVTRHRRVRHQAIIQTISRAQMSSNISSVLDRPYWLVITYR
jgi:hypothetical protein